MPRLVRREPFLERILSALNPIDHFFKISEELDSQDWDAFTHQWGRSIGFAINLIFLIARSNVGSGSKKSADDIFLEESETELGFGGWVSWLSSTIAFFFTIFSFLNAAYTFTSTRRYRLFEAPLDKAPSTPSAHRVPANSSPISSPFHALINAVRTPLVRQATVFSSSSSLAANQRKQKKIPEVWELSVWNPSALSLLLFCSFSPGHVLVYDLLLPVSYHDPRPSITVVKAIFFGFLLTAQLTYLHSNYSQQSQDLAILHKAVANEYDVKFVRPALTQVRRDVGVQANPPPSYDQSPVKNSRSSIGNNARVSEVDVYASTPVYNRGFHVRPNPTYTPLLDQDRSSSSTSASSSISSWMTRPSTNTVSRSNASVGPTTISSPSNPNPNLNSAFSPSPAYRQPAASLSANMATGSRHGMSMSGAGGNTGPSPYRTSASTNTNSHISPLKREYGGSSGGGGDGGSLGVLNHAASPVRKSRLSTSATPRARR